MIDERDPIDRFFEDSPEPKIELVDGALVVGNTLAGGGLGGSRYLLHELLVRFDAELATNLAPKELWWRALHHGFQSLSPPAPNASAAEWTAWAASVSYQPEIEPAGPCVTGWHRVVSQNIAGRFHRVDHRGGFGVGIGPDFAMRLGEDALTPDAMMVRYDRLDDFHEYFFEGAPDLVIEVLMEGKDPARDREWKRRRFEEVGVGEYWLVDPEAQAVEFLRLTGEGYRQRTVAEDGRYRPLPFPGLALEVDELWDRKWSTPGPFYLEAKLSDSECKIASTKSYKVPFAPRIGLEPTPIRFEEFISWCPEAKTILEIDSHRAIKRWIVGMLLMTFGLTSATGVLEPQRWVQALSGPLREEAASSVDPMESLRIE